MSDETPHAHPMPFDVPTVEEMNALLPQYEFRKLAAFGGMGAVYRAQQASLDRPVAVKILPPAFGKEAEFADRFKTEARAMAKLNHTNIVTVYDFGISREGHFYLVMEWVEGLGLNFLVDSKSHQLNGQRINFVGQLCDALQFLHDSKYLHRDLCPRNVMVTNEGVVKLIDFGLTIPYTPQFCVPGNRTGTVDFLAPEIIKRGTTDHRVDLFALGTTAFEMFVGQLPWEKSLNSDDTVRRRLNTPPRQAKALKPTIEDDLAKLLMKSIAVDRNERFNSATEFKEALLKLQRQDY